MNLQAFTRRAVPPIMAAVAFGAGLTACGQASSPQPPASSAPATPTAPVAASTAPSLSESELQFVADVRNVLSFGSNVTEPRWHPSGSVPAMHLQSGTTLADEVPPARRAFPTLSKGDSIQLITHRGEGPLPGSVGPAAGDLHGHRQQRQRDLRPVRVRLPGQRPADGHQPLVGNPQFYSISVQLKDSGTVTCQIKVDGVTIVSASASGTTSVASCAMDQDLNGSWEETSLNG